jgi:HlyD family secretion protein
MKAFEYSSFVVIPQERKPRVIIPGSLHLDQEYQVFSEADGSVVEIVKDVGQYVQAGEVIAKLDVDEKKLAEYEKYKGLLESLPSLANVKSEMKRIDQYYANGYYGPAEADNLRNRSFSMVNQILRYQDTLEQLAVDSVKKIIKAPVSGIVTEITWRVGDYVNSRRQEYSGFRIAPGQSEPIAELELSDEMLPRIKEGQKVFVSVPFSQQKPVEGVITTIPRKVFNDRQKRFFVAKAKLSNPPEHFSISGTRILANVEFQHNEKNLWIPRDAFDLVIDEKFVQEEISYLKKGKSLSRTLASKEKNDQRDQRLKKSPLKKAIETEALEHDDNIQTIYLVTENEKIIKAKVEVDYLEGDFVAVKSEALKGMKVVTSFKPNSNILTSLLK